MNWWRVRAQATVVRLRRVVGEWATEQGVARVGARVAPARLGAAVLNQGWDWEQHLESLRAAERARAAVVVRVIFRALRFKAAVCPAAGRLGLLENQLVDI